MQIVGLDTFSIPPLLISDFQTDPHLHHHHGRDFDLQKDSRWLSSVKDVSLVHIDLPYGRVSLLKKLD